jgi:hypothetical protein
MVWEIRPELRAQNQKINFPWKIPPSSIRKIDASKDTNRFSFDESSPWECVINASLPRSICDAQDVQMDIFLRVGKEYTTHLLNKRSNSEKAQSDECYKMEIFVWMLVEIKSARELCTKNFP